MRNWIWPLAAFVVLALSSSFGVEGPKKSKGIFSWLKVGQNVDVKEEGKAFSISFFDDDTLLNHKIIEVGEDHVVVRDLAGVRETVLPVYAIKSISKMTTQLK